MKALGPNNIFNTNYMFVNFNHYGFFKLVLFSNSIAHTELWWFIMLLAHFALSLKLVIINAESKDYHSSLSEACVILYVGCLPQPFGTAGIFRLIDCWKWFSCDRKII